MEPSKELVKVESDRLTVINRAQEALRRRRNGDPLNEIAYDLGLTPKECNRLIIKALKATFPATSREALKHLEIARLEEVGRLVMEALAAGANEGRLNTRLVDSYVKVAELRSKLAGSLTLAGDPREEVKGGKRPKVIQFVDIGSKPGSGPDEAVPAPEESVGQ